ncbi:MAG: hypothetical protein ABWZ80_02770, partial [Beijerinckiaceae bacterium]
VARGGACRVVRWRRRARTICRWKHAAFGSNIHDMFTISSNRDIGKFAFVHMLVENCHILRPGQVTLTSRLCGSRGDSVE